MGIVICVILTGCEPLQNDDQISPDDEFEPVYMGTERTLLDVDLVSLQVIMTGARTEEDIMAYAECAIADYALNRSYGFARHVRTNVTIKAGIWAADAVYTISPTLPQGLRTIDAEITVQNCESLGIPTF